MQNRREHRYGLNAGSAGGPAAAPATRSGRPMLTLKGHASASQSSASVEETFEPIGIVGDGVPAPTNRTDAKKARSQRPYRPWPKDRGPVPAQAVLVERSRAINALLKAPIGVLPDALGDMIRPFRVGVGPEIIAHRRPDVTIADCEKVLRDYARSFAYRLAIAQPGSMRHDIDGNPVEPVSAADREHAQRSILTTQEKSRQRKAQRTAGDASAAVGAETVPTSEPSASSVTSGLTDR